MVQWLGFTPEVVDQEIQATIWRNRIEESTFGYNTYEVLHYEFHLKLSKEDYSHPEERKYSVIDHKKAMTMIVKSLKEKTKS